MALGTEPRPAIVYTMVADARLRDGQPGSAIEILKPAHERDPANDEIARRLAIAYAMTGRFADALPVADKYLERHATDQDMLLAAITSQYELFRSGQVLSNVDRAKMRSASLAYKGPDRVLLDKSRHHHGSALNAEQCPMQNAQCLMGSGLHFQR